MFETFQGWCSAFYPKDYIKTFYKLCKENDILVAFDEIQAGFGRTGLKFGLRLGFNLIASIMRRNIQKIT